LCQQQNFTAYFQTNQMIAFFDSGYGGYTIMAEVEKLLPDYEYLYLGDNFRAPYGNHSPDRIKDLSESAVEYLFAQGATLIIIACNTICASSLRHLQEKYLREPNVKNRKILGIITPTVEYAAQKVRGKIAVIGTRATIESQVYDIELTKIDPKVSLVSKACPLLVPLIEENWHKKPEAKMILKKYLHSVKTHNPEILIPACTHYPFMDKDIRRFMGKKTIVLNQGEIVANSLKNYLQRHPEIESNLKKSSIRNFQTTGDAEKFSEMLRNAGAKHILQVEKVVF
jgi:glutamate racemase